MPRYTVAQIAAMREEAKAVGCTAPALFWEGSPEKLTEVCNGVGAEDSPQVIRDLLTWIYRYYTTAAAIHDCRYELSDCSCDNRKDADDEFRENALKIHRKRYGFFWWASVAGRAGRRKIIAAHFALREWADAAWRSAYYRNLEKEDKQ